MDTYHLEDKDVIFILKKATTILKAKDITEDKLGSKLKFRDKIGELMNLTGDAVYNQMINNPKPYISDKSLKTLIRSVDQYFKKLDEGSYKFDGFSKTQFKDFHEKILSQKIVAIKNKKQGSNQFDQARRKKEDATDETKPKNENGELLNQSNFLRHFENSSWDCFAELKDIRYQSSILIFNFKSLISFGYLQTELRISDEDDSTLIWKGKTFVNLKCRSLVGEVESINKEYPFIHFTIRLPDISDDVAILDGIYLIFKKSENYIKQNLLSAYFTLKKSTVPLENVAEQLQRKLYINGKNSISILDRNPDPILKQTYFSIYKTFGKKVMYYKSENESSVQHDFVTLEELGSYEYVIRIHIKNYGVDFDADSLLGYGIPNLYDRYIAFNLRDPIPDNDENIVEQEFAFLTLFFSKFYNKYGLILGSLTNSSSSSPLPEEDKYIYQTTAILIDYDIWLRLNEKEKIMSIYLDKFDNNVSRTEVDSLVQELEKEIGLII